MRTKLGRMRQKVACLGLTCLCLLVASASLSAQEPKLLATLNGHTDVVMSVVFSPDGMTMASASFDKTIKLWDFKTRKERATFTGYTAPVLCAVFSPNGKTLASATTSLDLVTEFKLWDLATGEEQASVKERFGGSGVAFSPDGKTLATAGIFDMKLWDVLSDKEKVTIKERITIKGNGLSSLDTTGNSARQHSLAFSPDGKTLLSGGGTDNRKGGAPDDPKKVRIPRKPGEYLTLETLTLWDVQTGAEKSSLLDAASNQPGSTPWGALSVAFNPSGDMVAAGMTDETIRLRDLKTGKWTTLKMQR